MYKLSSTSRLSASAVLLIALASSHASAVVVDSVGDSFSVYFNGIIDEAEQPGLTANADFLLTDITADGQGGLNWTFDVTLNNTSTLPITDSRVSILAFDTNPDADLNESSVSGVFDMVASGNMPMVGDMELCFKDAGGNNCAGGGNGGVSIGESGDFIAVLNFDTVADELLLTNFHVRYQSIDGSTLGDSGIGEEVPQIPVPAAIWLFGSALLGLAGAARNRR